MADVRSITQNRTKDTPIGSVSQQHQSTSLQGSMNAGESSTSTIQPFKPSKAFLEKCATAQEALLEQIKPQYHDQLRSLYQNELNADIFIQIGDSFTKPLHGCILASRVFRFYNTLRLFKLNSRGSSIQERENDITKSSLVLSHNHVYYSLPSDLISPELFKNFARRIYLDEDVREEELRLTTKLGDWLKLNKPNLIKTAHIPSRYSPNHKATFRTIIPDFEVNDNSPIDKRNMTEPDSIESTSNNKNGLDSLERASSFENRTSTPHEDGGNQLTSRDKAQGDDFRKQHQLSSDNNNRSQQDPSSAGLPRTGTFEKLTSKLEDMNLDRTPSSLVKNSDAHQTAQDGNNSQLSSNNTVNAQLNSSQDDGGSECGADISSADGSNAPTPPSHPTQMGPSALGGVGKGTKSQTLHVVPKQRTSTTTTNQKSTSSSQGRPAPRENNETTSVSSKTKMPVNGSSTSGGVSNLQISQKRSTSTTVAARVVPSSRTTPTSTKTQQTVSNPMVARAKPISLERAHSPILMGKQSRHQFKVTTPTGHRQAAGQGGAHDRRLVGTPQTGYDSETLGSEISDSGSFALDSPSAPSGYISIDRYTLASYSKLAEAMTRMFFEEIEADVIINVGGTKQIRAHKCILATRSAYLAETIEKQSNLHFENQGTTKDPPEELDKNDGDDDDGDGGVEAKTSRRKVQDIHQIYINLTDFSYTAVHFALLHLYSGIVKVTDDIELEELAKLTHLLHVGTLRQICQHNLRMTYCHFFHKPCNLCTLGVLKTLPLAWRYDYSDLYTKCLQWIGTHFASIFCLKEFSELRPTDLIEECYSATLNQLQPENIIQRTLECQKLLKNLPRVKWTESIIGLVGRQLEDFCHYVADNYDKILQTDSFMSLGKNCWECEILEENLLAAMNHLKPDMGCKCLVLLHKIECSNETFNDDSAGNHQFSDSFANLVSKMRKYCERYLIREASQVVHCSSWKQMNPSLQRKIRDQALISVDFDDPTRHLSNKPKLTSSLAKRGSQPSHGLHHNTGHNNSSSSGDPTGYPSSISRPSSGPGAQLPPMKSKKIVSRHVKVLPSTQAK